MRTRMLCMSLLLGLSLAAQDWQYQVPAEIPADVYRARRTRLLQSLPEGCIFVLAAAEPLGELYPYRQSSDFYYLSGVEQPGGVLLLYRAGEQSLDRLYLPPRNRQQEVWEGARMGPGEATAQLLGFAEVPDRRKLADDLQGLLAAATEVASCARWEERGSPPALSQLEEQYPTLVEAIEAGDVEVRNAAFEIGELRLVKSAGEIERLRQAVAATGVGLSDAMRQAHAGMAEFQIEAVIEFGFFRRGAARVGFPSIVGAGANSCVLHYMHNNGGSQDGDLVVCDVGAEFGMYTADVTRTFPVNGRFSARQREIYQIVLRAQQAGFEACRPGATVRQVHAAASRVINAAGYGRYFPHGTSHWLGLDVHDVGDYDRPLEPGMVLTVEPGIYLPDENLGIRIEDDVLITEDGYEILSRDIPSSPDAIEALMDRLAEPSWF